MNGIKSHHNEEKTLKPAASPVSRKTRAGTNSQRGEEVGLIDNSPRQSMQSAAVSQLQGIEEEELMQGKGLLQRESPEEEALMQGKMTGQRQPLEEEAPLQGKRAPSIQRSPAGNSGIPPHVQTKMETAMNTDFSNVNIHPNSGKAPEVGALAYTQGNDVHFAPGQFRPETGAGQELLGHELAHVVQQREGRVRPTTEVAGMPVNDNPALEKEADDLGTKAAKI